MCEESQSHLWIIKNIVQRWRSCFTNVHSLVLLLFFFLKMENTLIRNRRELLVCGHRQCSALGYSIFRALPIAIIASTFSFKQIKLWSTFRCKLSFIRNDELSTVAAFLPFNYYFCLCVPKSFDSKVQSKWTKIAHNIFEKLAIMLSSQRTDSSSIEETS